MYGQIAMLSGISAERRTELNLLRSSIGTLDNDQLQDAYVVAQIEGDYEAQKLIRAELKRRGLSTMRTRLSKMEFGVGLAALGVLAWLFLRRHRQSTSVAGLRGLSGHRNNPDYKFYVLGPSGKVHSGWEYRDDAKDSLLDDPTAVKKVYAKVTLKKMGIDVDNDDAWGE